MAEPRGLRLPRPLHPGAWWLWAIGMATAASRTTNPLLLCLLLAAVAVVVAARRTDAPWALGIRVYVLLGLAVIAIRILFRALLDGQAGGHTLVTLPEVPLPAAAAGIRLGGPVSLEGVVAAFYDGLRLATLLLCVGAANVLANPKRLLKAVPAALHEVGVAVTVALSVAPQLVESGQRVRAARRLRGDPGRRRHLLRQVAIPVMTDALDRSLLLAAGMESRGYGRSAAVPAGVRRATATLLLGGLTGMAIGTYGLLDSTAPRWLGIPMLLVGTAAGWGALALAARRVSRTRYRPDPWLAPEWAVMASGLLVAIVVVGVSVADPVALAPSVQPLTWPSLPLLPALAVAVGAVPAWLAPPVRLPPPARRPVGVPVESAA